MRTCKTAAASCHPCLFHTSERTSTEDHSGVKWKCSVKACSPTHTREKQNGSNPTEGETSLSLCGAWSNLIFQPEAGRPDIRGACRGPAFPSKPGQRQGCDTRRSATPRRRCDARQTKLAELNETPIPSGTPGGLKLGSSRFAKCGRSDRSNITFHASQVVSLAQVIHMVIPCSDERHATPMLLLVGGLFWARCRTPPHSGSSGRTPKPVGFSAQLYVTSCPTLPGFLPSLPDLLPNPAPVSAHPV